MRKLATLQRISNITQFPDADFIELAQVNDWKVVVKRGEFDVGDLCVYCEIDSFLPVQPEFEFLRKSSFRKMGEREGFRLKTMRMRGQYSQGLILPLSVLPSGEGGEFMKIDVGTDVTDLLGIVKWDPPLPACLAGEAKGYFPSFLRKTDEERIQNLSDEYPMMRNHTVVVTEKLDGSSVTYFLRNGEFGVCSRNLELKENAGNTFWAFARKNDIEGKLRALNAEYGRDYALQGELIGPGIQSNRYKLNEHTVRFFNVYDITTSTRLSHYYAHELIVSIGLQTVPVLTISNWLEGKTIAEVVELADGDSVFRQTPREGIVVRSYEDSSFSFKAISNKFLLKNDE